MQGNAADNILINFFLFFFPVYRLDKNIINLLSAEFAHSMVSVNPSPAEPICPDFANSVDPDQLASEGAN